MRRRPVGGRRGRPPAPALPRRACLLRRQHAGRAVAGGRGRAVGMCASAGGLTALGTVLQALPADLPVAIAVVLHIERTHRSRVAEILARRTALQVKEAEAGETMEPGVVYVAAPDLHLVAGAG